MQILWHPWGWIISSWQGSPTVRIYLPTTELLYMGLPLLNGENNTKRSQKSRMIICLRTLFFEMLFFGGLHVHSDLWAQHSGFRKQYTGLHDIVPFTRILESSKYAPLNPKPRTPHMQLHFSRVTNPIMYYYPPSCLLQIQGWNHILCKSWCYSTMLPNPEHVIYTSPSLSSTKNQNNQSKKENKNQSTKSRTRAHPFPLLLLHQKTKRNNPTNQTKTKAKGLTGLGFRVLVDSANMNSSSFLLQPLTLRRTHSCMLQ